MVSPQESLKQKMLLDSFSKNISYIPEGYAEVETDTTLSNGFRVVIKLQSKMDSSVLVETKKDSSINKTYYRDFVGTISVFRNDTLLLSKEISKLSVLEQNKSTNDFLKKLILSDVWVNYCAFDNKEYACINMAYCKPESLDSCLYFELSVDTTGKTILKEIKN